jgi:hypothetical protein
MLCPICNSEIIQGSGYRVYQTLEEHVCSPNDPVCPKEYFVCSNSSCVANSFVYWDEMGESYRLNENYFEMKEKYPYTVPMNSWAKKKEIELEKHDEDFILLNLFFIRWKVKFEYEGNEQGQILNRKFKIETHVHSRHGWQLHYSSLHMFIFCIEWFKSILDRYERNPDNKYVIEELLREFKADNDRRLYKKLSNWWINWRYSRVRKLLQAEILFSK